MGGFVTVYDRRNDGFILVAVIWISGLLALVTTVLILQTQSNTLLSRNNVFNTKAELIADGLTQLLALKLATPSNPLSAKANGETQYCAWQSSANAAYRIQDQAGLVDLNTASPPLLLSLLSGIGLDDAVATQFYDNLVDFRDADHISASGGDEPILYPGKHYGPKNAPFETVDELSQIPHLDNVQLSRLRELTTVYAQAPGIDFVQAPSSLVKALGANGILDMKLQPFAYQSPAKTFGIDVLIETNEKAHFVRHAIVALQQQPGRPFAILAWQQGADVAAWGATAKVTTPCFN